MDADLQVPLGQGGPRLHVALRHAGRLLERRLSSAAGEWLLLGARDLEDAIKPDANIAFVGPFQAEHLWRRSLRPGIKPEAMPVSKARFPRTTNKTKNPPAPPKAKAQPTAKEVAVAAPAAALVTGKPARFVRIELPGDKRILTLAEVEVFSAGRNIAAGGKATQSSTNGDAAASAAIDGNKHPNWEKGGQTHTSTMPAKRIRGGN
jgi:hypothetical protein